MICFKLFYLFFNADSCSKRKCSHIIFYSRRKRCYKIGEAKVCLPIFFQVLVPEITKAGPDSLVILLIIDHQVISIGIGWKDAVYSICSQPFFIYDFLQHLLCIIIKLPGLGTIFRVLKDIREFSPEFPGGKKEDPVDVFGDLFHWVVNQYLQSGLLWVDNCFCRPCCAQTVTPGILQREVFDIPAGIRIGVS